VIRALALAALVVGACGGASPAATTPAAPARPDILLATTTSFQDSGLLDVLVADFAKRTGYRIRATAVGTGAALAIGEKGDADVVFVHAPKAELEFMSRGAGERRLLVMHNDFVILGPPDDPAAIKGAGALDALRRISTRRATFISRGDKSGTNLLELDLWQQLAIEPSGSWYVQAATGMGQTLTIASEKKAYTISDRGTYLARRAQLQLGIVVERDPPLLNPYHVITIDPKRFPRVNAAGANAFAEYLVSPETQRLIASFGVEQYGQPLFFPDAGKRDEDVGR
jgi:tungstate transport system substrate-binding protein